MNYTQVGKIVHYFDKIQVGVLQVTDGEVKVGDTIRVGDEATGFEQKVESLQIEHKPVDGIKTGEEAGLKLDQPSREGTLVYKVSE